MIERGRSSVVAAAAAGAGSVDAKRKRGGERLRR